MQFELYQPSLGTFQHVVYQNTYAQAVIVDGDTFMDFHTLLYTISHNFHTISKSFRYHWLEKMKATDKIDFRARDLAFNISVHREKIQGKNNYIISYTHLINH